MKKKHILATLILFCCFFGNARIIPMEEAKIVANNFISKHSFFTSKGLSHCDFRKEDIIQYEKFYAFNIGVEQGFILISSQTNEPMVLGYSDRGQFEEENIPPQLKYALQNSTRYCLKDNDGAANASYGEGILYPTAEWGQNAPFNDFAPNHAPAGCVAAAMSIVMNYHQWPDRTRGGIQYDWYHQDLSLDFDNYIIDWDALSDKDNANFGREAAMLYKSTGIASNMIYGSGENEESTAEVWGIGMKMIEHYAYDKECQYVEKSAFEDAEWNKLIRIQLDEVGPVIYRGGGNISSHCFVIDGYNAEGYYHVNWGWNGNLNGYYALDFSDIGGLNFSENQGMVINIKPDKDKNVYSKAFLSNLNNYTYDGYTMSEWNFSQSKIDTGGEINFITPTITLNRQNGFFCVAVVDENDNILQIVGIDGNECPVAGRDYMIAFDDAPFCSSPGTRFEFKTVFPPLKEGQRYQLVSQDAILNELTGKITPDVPSNNHSDYRLILGGIFAPTHFYAENNPSHFCTVKVHIDENMPYFSDQYGFQSHDFTLTKLLKTEFVDSYTIPSTGVSMEVCSFDKDGNEKSPIYQEIYDAQYDKFVLKFNVSLYEPRHEVYFHYEPADSRRSKDIPTQELLEDNDLVYRIEGGNCSLIGYNPTLAGAIEIPPFVSNDGKQYKVTEICNEALLHCPITDLSINDENLTSIGILSFAGMKNLNNLSFENVKGDKFNTWFLPPFLMSTLSNVYSRNFLPSVYLEAIGGYYFGFFPSVDNNGYIERPKLNYYFSALPNDKYFNETIQTLATYNYLSNESFSTNVYESLQIPGVGNYYSSILEEYHAPYQEMWRYALDKENKLVGLLDLKDNVTVNSVTINGKVAERNSDGYYCTQDESDEIKDVDVFYTVNNYKNMSTHYNVDYNGLITSEELASTPVIGAPDKFYDLFNLQGVKVRQGVSIHNLPNNLPRGIYILNGQKVIIK